ncbi:ABC transporter substrate-binding protein [uncultured Methylobacterium sp.]|uniref:ABC transporter substrate-binding protein n=1 Tax=uncultured Methylobacterium sp. TaxID=157278 RepID=UPI00258948BD|nr:ABC transporter substrate-binding protein [uncultured Methylobacterium sp.]
MPVAFAHARRLLRRGSLALTGLWLALSPAAAQSGPPVKIGVLTDLSSLYADNGGSGSVVAARMAVEDFGGRVLGRPIEVVSADHQNKTDVGAALARRWLDADDVKVIVDVPNSAIALAVQDIARERGRIFLASGAATSRLTGEACSPTGIHWTYDTYALAQGTARAVTRRGGKSWYFVTADYALGTQLEEDSRRVIQAAGGRVLGSVRHPIGSADFSSYLLQAQGSGAQVVGLADAGGDLILALKQAAEFGIVQSGQTLAGLLVFIADIHGLGLAAAQGLILSTAFYWNFDEATRAWSQRFVARTNKVPTMIHAGTYGAVTHYLKAMAAANTDDGPTVAAQMRRMPVNDFMTRDGRIREDGRLVRDIHLMQVKAPSESKGRFDYYKLLETIPGEDAFRPLSAGNCPLVKRG